MSQLAQIAPYAGPLPAIRTRFRVWHIFAMACPLAWLYFPVLVRLVKEWWKDPNYSHAFLVPVFSVYLLVMRRRKIQALLPDPSWWGLLIVGLSMGMLVIGEIGAEIFLSRLSLLFLILGFIVLFGGWKYARVLLFPWAFLFFMIPVPAIAINQITIPLQIFASKLAAATLPLLGVPVFREGNVINLPAMPLQVAEACSGIRSLIALTSLTVVYGELSERSGWLRVLLAIASIPLAISANSLRIIGTGLLVQYWAPDAARGFFHSFSGWLMFLVSLGMLFAVHKVLLGVSTGFRERYGI